MRRRRLRLLTQRLNLFFALRFNPSTLQGRDADTQPHAHDYCGEQKSWHSVTPVLAGEITSRMTGPTTSPEFECPPDSPVQ